MVEHKSVVFFICYLLPGPSLSSPLTVTTKSVFVTSKLYSLPYGGKHDCVCGIVSQREIAVNTKQAHDSVYWQSYQGLSPRQITAQRAALQTAVHLEAA